MTALDVVSIILMTVGAVFFFAGSVGLLRFPDVYTRLHALTKGDNLGLGFIVVALMLRSGSFIVAAKMLLIWVLVLVSAATASHVVARAARLSGIKPWTRP